MRVTEIKLYHSEMVFNTSQDIYRQSTELLSIPLRLPGPGDRFHVKAIFGLDADDLISRFSGRDSWDNSEFRHMSMGPREIVMRIALYPNWESGEVYSDLRDQVYQTIAQGRDGLLDIILFDGPAQIAKISGSVTKVESPLFNEDPEMQITIKCNDPMFRSVAPISHDINSDPVGNFAIFDGVSTAPHGFEMSFEFRTVVPDFALYDRVSGYHTWFFSVRPPDGAFQTGDIVYLNSEPRNRQITRTRGGTTISIADGIELGSKWPILFPGRENSFWSEQLMYSQIEQISFSYHTSFWGV